jgi:hypothetical protein
MVSVLASSAVDCGFEPRSGQTKDYKFGICCFSTKHTALRRKSKDGLTRNQDNVFELRNRNEMTDRNQKLSGNTTNLSNRKEIDNNRKGVR